MCEHCNNDNNHACWLTDWLTDWLNDWLKDWMNEGRLEKEGGRERGREKERERVALFPGCTKHRDRSILRSLWHEGASRKCARALSAPHSALSLSDRSTGCTHPLHRSERERERMREGERERKRERYVEYAYWTMAALQIKFFQI